MKAGRKGLLIEQPNHLDKSKHIFSDLHSTLAQTGPNNEITDEGFNEALRKSQKDTVPSLDKVQYSDIENLTEEGRVVHYLPRKLRVDAQLLEICAQTRERPWQYEGVLYSNNAEHHRKNHERIVAWKLTMRDLEDRKIGTVRSSQ